jgi:hypothetical protein
LQANRSVNFRRPTLNFQQPARSRATAISLASRRAGLAPAGVFITRDPRFALSQELEAKQTLLDQLRALAADDPDFFTDLLEGDTNLLELIVSLDASILDNETLADGTHDLARAQPPGASATAMRCGNSGPADALGVKQELEKALAQDGKPTK